jgi:hypothetical protein
MKYIYKSQIVDEDTDRTVATISSYSEEGLEEEMGKRKWTEAIKKYENELELENKIANEEIEDLQADHDCHLDELGEGHCDNPIHN